MPDANSFLARLLAADDPAQAERNRQFRFEERVVKQILRAAGITTPAPVLAKEAAAETDYDSLTFEWFESRFPAFPMRLATKKMRWVQNIRISNIFGSGFAKMPIFKEYQKFADLFDIDVTTTGFGLVFALPHAQGGANMILHNCPGAWDNHDPEMWPEHTTRIIRCYGRPAILYVIEQLDGLLRSLGNSWVPPQDA